MEEVWRHFLIETPCFAHITKCGTLVLHPIQKHRYTTP